MAITYPVHVDIYKLLISLTEATDLISRPLVNHHKQVSAIAFHIGNTMGLSKQDLQDLATAAAMHDIGGLSLASRIETLEFEMAEPEHHALSGKLLLSLFKPFAGIADIIRYHHLYWQGGAGDQHNGQPVPRLSHLLHLADRIAVSIDKNQDVLKQVRTISNTIKVNSGRMFVPEMVQAFEEIAIKESFWLEVAEPQNCPLFTHNALFGTTCMQEQDLLDLTKLFCRIIDFRSRFTATHSSGVADVAELLAHKAGLDKEECKVMWISGLLHDIGKLIVPQEILEKETPLTKEDYIIIHRHPYYSQRILQTVPGFETICTLSAYHHERLDGTGYPFHVNGDELEIGTRILSAADTFTALTETRPYRSSTSGRGTLKFLEKQARDNKLDSDVVALINSEIDEFNAVREKAQKNAFELHTRFTDELDKGVNQSAAQQVD